MGTSTSQEESSDIEKFDFRVEAENKERELISKNALISNNDAKPTEMYKGLAYRSKIAKYTYILYIFCVPMVFRYVIYASVKRTEGRGEFIAVGNGTITMETDWACNKCGFGIPGILIIPHAYHATHHANWYTDHAIHANWSSCYTHQFEQESL